MKTKLTDIYARAKRGYMSNQFGRLNVNPPVYKGEEGEGGEGGGEDVHSKHFFYSFETLFLPAPFGFSSWLPNPLGIFLKKFADNFFPHISDIRYDTYSIHEVTLLLNTKNVSSGPHHEKIRTCQEQEQNILSQFAYLERQKKKMQFLNFFDEAFQVSLISHSQPLALTHDLARNTNLTYFVEDTMDFLFQNNKISNLVIFSLKI